jgi:hypothetical protein
MLMTSSLSRMHQSYFRLTVPIWEFLLKRLELSHRILYLNRHKFDAFVNFKAKKIASSFQAEINPKKIK